MYSTSVCQTLGAHLIAIALNLPTQGPGGGGGSQPSSLLERSNLLLIWLSIGILINDPQTLEESTGFMECAWNLSSKRRKR